ncbi:MAG: valine--tRNA ligase [Planctomycetota bacterium]|nr:MAG: valine--tRNA ligase [Planctomycetota bacterium]REK25570.1 MAG: valine--tRNA ligase [Planctomycetota bacterium]REK31718.1 MAG: valine--tRNA ligase [Planctomycetota bacterium]
MSDIPKQYDPRAAQEKWFAFWETHGYFNADPNAEKKPHTIMIPLPNVTGALHMGHALNGTCQDLITRWRRMQGYEALWMPGTDHAGIATQAVVERRMLEEEGLTRHDIGREALVNRIWKWKESYEKRIIGQLKQLGASCDWRRRRFTLDDVCSKAVRRTFFKLFKDGYIYRGKRLVNWDTYLQTAVADDEVFEEEIDGHFWTFHYPVVDDSGNDTTESIRFATTRPETMLGDTAVCVHPTDERYTHLIGKRVRIPLNDRLIPIIADALLADKELGTGAVKVTPAHDPNDYACYQRNPEIGVINILNPDGTLNEDGGEWQGQDRYDVRDKVVERMSELGFYDGIEDRKIPLKHSDRSKTPVEPYLSDQWFVAMDELAQNAIDAVEDGRVRFYPSRYAKTYLDWLGEKRDWCISRQLWWGHRIPIWSKPLPEPQSDSPEDPYRHERIEHELPEEWSGSAAATIGDGVEPGQKLLLICVDEGNPEIEQQLESDGFEQDPDVLDTWFSSALWPHATLGWPDEEHDPPLDEEEVAKQSPAVATAGRSGSPSTIDPRPSTGQNEVLATFYPGSVLVTSRDIITLWVARMVLTGLYNMGDVPFKHVCVHPKILDGFGQTMSKSKGNGVDPMDLIDKYGTDAVRFTIASFAGETQDVRLPVGYECPHCGTVIPQTLEHQKAIPAGGEKPRIKCPNKKCKQESQFSSAWFDPDPGEPVARIVSERFEYGRNFCNKFWNAARFAMMNLEGYTPAPVTADQLQLEDRWILSRLATVVAQMNEYLGRYQFDAATRTIREFTWNEFCDWYLEMVKPRLRGDEGQAPSDEARAVAQRVLLAVLDSLVRMLQPFAPYICEELWQRLAEIAPERALPPSSADPRPSTLDPRRAEGAAIIAAWPELPSNWRDESLEKRFERLQDTIVAVRNVRAIYNIPPSTQLELMVRAPAEVAGDLQNVAAQFDNLAKAVLAAAGADVVRPPASASFSLDDADGYVPLEGIINRDAEIERQEKEAEKLRKHIAGHEGKLANESFVSKAPPEVVADVRETLDGLKKQLASVEEILRDLSDS